MQEILNCAVEKETLKKTDNCLFVFLALQPIVFVFSQPNIGP